jgi:hypothetical protein
MPIPYDPEGDGGMEAVQDDLIERLNASTRDCVTGEPLDNDARPDLYAETIREAYAKPRTHSFATQRLGKPNAMRHGQGVTQQRHASGYCVRR